MVGTCSQADWSALSPDIVLEILKAAGPEEECAGDDLEGFAGLAKSSAKAVDVDTFMKLLRDGLPCIDVRSPCEFEKGHITGAVCLPLFSDEERAQVGTMFKQVGRTQALELGMEHVRPKLEALLDKASDLMTGYANANKRILVHCFRGGMRSSSVAWLLRFHGGLEPILLRGGYKAFRAWARDLYCFLEEGYCYKKVIHQEKEKALVKAKAGASGELETIEDYDVVTPSAEELEWCKNHPGKRPQIVIVGGRTGCGKTRVLHQLRDAFGQQVLDLEGLAHHCGSAFGWCGHEKQPTTQQFDNDVAFQWSGLDPDRWVFVEDEGPNVGMVSTPMGLYKCMREAPVVIKLKVPMEARVHVLVDDYASDEVRTSIPDWEDKMLQSILSLKKRVGDQRMQELNTLLKAGKYADFSRVLLKYYDQLYDKHIQSAGGTGSGEGGRKGMVLEIRAAPTHDQRLDAHDVARQALDALRAFEASSKSENSLITKTEVSQTVMARQFRKVRRALLILNHPAFFLLAPWFLSGWFISKSP